MAKESKERRKYARADVEIPITYTCDNKEFKGTAKNIGAGGVLIHCSQPLKLNTVIALCVDLPSGSIRPMYVSSSVCCRISYPNDSKIAMESLYAISE